MKRNLLPVVVAAALAGCTAKSASNANASTAEAAQKVAVATVESGQLRTVVPLPAQVVPFESVDVFPKVNGFIESIAVDRGSRVHSGQVIARLSAPELVAQRAQADARLRAAQSQLAATKAKLASDEGTYAHLAAAAKTPGVVAGNELSIAEQTAAADRAKVDAAENNVRAVEDELRSVTVLEGYLNLRAPFNGIVTQRNLHPGALVGPSSGAPSAQPIVQVQSIDRLRVVVPVPEAYAGDVKEGRVLGFSVPSHPDRTFHAPIARVSRSFASNTRSMAVELDVRNTDGALTPGAFATVQWPVQRAYATAIVPASAIATDLERTFVIRVRDGKAEWVDIKSGISANSKTEVFGDLHYGEKVVANATDAIRPGAMLQPQ